MTDRTHWSDCWRERAHHACAVARIAGLEEALADALTGYSIAAFALDENDEALNAALGDKTAGIQRWRIMRLASERDAAIKRAEAAEKGAAQYRWLFNHD